MEYLPLVIEPIPQPDLLTFVHDLFRTPHRHLRQSGNLLGSPHSRFHAPVRAPKTPRSNPPPLRIRAAESLARQNQLHRLGLPHRSRQSLAPACARDDPELDLWLAERRAFRTVEDVCHQGEFAPAAKGVPVHCGDDGFPNVGDCGRPAGNEVCVGGIAVC